MNSNIIDTSAAFPLSRRGEGPNQIDIYVGNRLRLRRTMLGFSQDALGTAVGITFQQLQKYERGINRISASRLYQLSTVLGVSVSYFFEGFEYNDHGADAVCDEVNDDTPSTRETLELFRAYSQVANPEIRHRIIELFRAVGGPDQHKEEAA